MISVTSGGQILFREERGAANSTKPNTTKAAKTGNQIRLLDIIGKSTIRRSTTANKKPNERLNVPKKHCRSSRREFSSILPSTLIAVASESPVADIISFNLSQQ
jgi:hypothetical protein